MTHASIALLQHTILATQVASTFALFGLIWFVQIVHYPLFLRIPPQSFAAHEAEHATRTGWVAAPLMLAELLSALLLLPSGLRPAQINAPEALLGAALVALIWLSTVFLQIPLHNRLHRGFDRATIQRLVASQLAAHRRLDYASRSGYLLALRTTLRKLRPFVGKPQ